MVLEPLVDRFVSDYEAKSLGLGCAGGALHIEIAEKRGVGHDLVPLFFARNEMKLVVDAGVWATDCQKL